MHKYIEELTELISNCPMENTYKMSWCRALVEHCCYNSDRKIHFDKLSELIFKYYWNQSIFFNLEQGPNINKRPAIHQIVKDEIQKYRKVYGQQPVNFIRAGDKINIDIAKISKILTYDSRNVYIFYCALIMAIFFSNAFFDSFLNENDNTI